MATINVSLPDPMKAWVDEQALIRHDQARAEKIARMQDLVTEGLESGVSARRSSGR